jgi:hypothetical protein
MDMPVSAFCKAGEIPSEAKVVRVVSEAGSGGCRVLTGRRDVNRSSTTKLGRSDRVTSEVPVSGSSLTRSSAEDSDRLSESVSESLRFLPSCLRKSSSTEYSLIFEREDIDRWREK